MLNAIETMTGADGASTVASVDPVDQIPPPSRLATLGLQHVLVMYAGAITVPLILGGALGLSK